MAPMISEKQVGFLTSLVREYFPADQAAMFVEVIPTYTRLQASREIDNLIPAVKAKRAEKLAAAPAPVSLEGMHKLPGDRIFKVQVAVHGSGREYAKELVQNEDGGFSFEYTQGAMRLLSLDTKMTLEQAKKFGALYGTCCVCGKTLTNETSIAEGIGPICSGRFA